MHRTGAQLIALQAVAGTFLAADRLFLEDGAVIEVDKVLCPDRQGRAAGVIEEEQAHFQVSEIGLIADDFQFRILQEHITGLPGMTALRTAFITDVGRGARFWFLIHSSGHGLS